MSTHHSPSATILAHAWANHRDGRNEAAVGEFDRILRDNPNDIDANYGLGLVQSVLGRHDQAIASFQKAKALVTKALEAEPGTDRWEMLQRMCDQRIAEAELATGKA